MPDWMFHIALPYLIATIFRIKEKRLVVFGSLMLDVSSFMFAFNEFTGLFNHLTLVNYFTLTHSILAVILFAIAFAFLTTNFVRGFVILLATGLFHMSLDLFQYGADLRLLWPISFQKFSYQLFDPSAKLMLVLSVAFFIIAILIEKKESIIPKIRLSKVQYAVIFILIYFVLSYLSIPRLNEENIYNSGFLKNPEDFYGKEISLTRAHVISNNEVEADGMGIFIKNKEFSIGDIVSLKGIYSKDGLEVTFDSINNNRKIGGSIIGLLIGLYLMIFGGFKNGFHYLKQYLNQKA